jgi:hypothetical protein
MRPAHIKTGKMRPRNGQIINGLACHIPIIGNGKKLVAIHPAGHIPIITISHDNIKLAKAGMSASQFMLAAGCDDRAKPCWLAKRRHFWRRLIG